MAVENGNAREQRKWGCNYTIFYAKTQLQMCVYKIQNMHEWCIFINVT
jgi:hypothetical protein